MSPADILETFMSKPSPAQVQMDYLRGEGVPTLALARDCGYSGFTLATAAAAFDGTGRFEFEADCHGSAEPTPAILALARDRFGEPVDIVAAAGDRLASWLGRAPMLGAQNLMLPRIAGEPVAVHTVFLDWLRGDRRGVLIIDAMQARWELAGEGPLLASSRRAARDLSASLTLPAPRIICASSTLRRAA